MLERRYELELLAGWLSEALDGHGRLGLVLAGAGLGKTALLERTAVLAADRGLRVLTARGGELEQEMPFGVVRQLFESAVEELSPAGRNAVFAGAAAPARFRLDVTDESGGGGDPLAVIHAFYWLLANLADGNPLLLAVDDLHWTDPQTGRWLTYLASRVADLPVLVVAAARPADPGGEEMLARIEATAGVRSIELAPLGIGAVAELVAGHVGRPGEEAFVAACHDATGGNPFFLLELLRAVAGDGIEPTGAGAELIPQLGIKGIARSILVRLARLGDDAGRLASAAAILGSDAELRHAAELAGLDRDAALGAWDALARGEILQARQPLEFIHPIARAAVYNELPPGERTVGHRRAGELLARDHADPQRIAAHAMACEPTADPNVVAWLRSAADSAVQAGAPDAAARYLERALDEPPVPALLARVNLELGRALTGLDSGRAAASLAKAAQSDDQSVRFLATRWWAYTLSWAGRMTEATAVFDAAIELASANPETGLHMIGTREFFAAWWGEEPNHAERRRRLSEQAANVDGRTMGERQLLAAAGVTGLLSGAVPARESLALADRLSGGSIEWTQRTGDVTQGFAVFAQIIGDDPDAAVALQTRAIPESVREGLTVDLAFAQVCLGIIRFRRGELIDAEVMARTAWNLMRAVGPSAAVVYWWSAAALIEILIARGELEEAAALFEETGFVHRLPTVVIFPWPGVLRGELALARGDTAEGVEILLETGTWLEQRGFGNPAYVPWRARLAPALAMLGRHEEARAVIEPAVQRARAFGAPWALGMALRAAGMARQENSLLTEAIDVLSPSACRLEHAHALLELGASLRRANQRAEARTHLRTALDLAYRCAATPLEIRAAEELAATGARPRRVMLSGLESLTASEHRVAELAARGLSNPEIAQQLFVSRRTVEAHLGHVYRKLDISSREQIPAELAPTGVSNSRPADRG